MNRFFKNVSVVSTAGMLVSGVAFAQIELSNEETGADSDNDNSAVVTETIDEDVTNSASIDNEAEAETDSGGNEANQNTGGGEVDTGDAEIDADLENEVNASSLELYTAVFGDVDGELENKTTGSNSDNTNVASVSQKLDVDLSNAAWLLNALGLSAMSGDNTANKNTGGGEVDTGDAEIGALIMNEINAGFGYAGTFGDVNVEASNEKTGADSDNDNSIVVKQTIDVDVTNKAAVKNAVYEMADTGGNEANKNTGGGMVRTGDAEADTEIENVINAGGSGYDLELPDVDVEATNKTTGFNSDNTNVVSISNTAEVDVSNKAEVKNDVGASADSGGNTANQNTGGGDVSTGDASVGISISNTVN